MGTKGMKFGRMSEERRRKISEAKNKKIKFNCDCCGKEASDKISSYNRKIRHFCSRLCYGVFRKTILPMSEQPSYRGVRKEGQSRQIYHRNYCKNNPENISHLKARWHAKKRGAEGNHSLQEWRALKEKHSQQCAICGEFKKLTKDHIIPISKGGTDNIDNIQPLCRNCNSKKHNKMPQHPHLLTNQ